MKQLVYFVTALFISVFSKMALADIAIRLPQPVVGETIARVIKKVSEKKQFIKENYQLAVTVTEKYDYSLPVQRVANTFTIVIRFIDLRECDDRLISTRSRAQRCESSVFPEITTTIRAKELYYSVVLGGVSTSDTWFEKIRPLFEDFLGGVAEELYKSS